MDTISNQLKCEIEKIKHSGLYKDERIIESSQNSQIIVNQKKSLIGVVTDGDLRRNMNKNLLEKKIADIMNKKPKVISQEKLAVEALNLMNKHKITQLFVTNRNMPMGVIHIHDLYRVGIK